MKEEDIGGIILGIGAAAVVILIVQQASSTPVFTVNPFAENPLSTQTLIVDARLQSPSVDLAGPAIFGNTYSANNIYGRYGR